MPLVRHQGIKRLIKDKYSSEDILGISEYLTQKDTFNLQVLENGLFPAASVSADAEYTAYDNVWLRDNVFVSFSQQMLGKSHLAANNLKALMSYLKKHRSRFENVIEGKVNPDNVMERPHVRFDGRKLQELDQEWNHAQNDALGYFLWFYCQLVMQKVVKPEAEDLEILALFPFYLQAIRYWEDEDSGHWEEDRKVEASSIGVAIAGLKQLKLMLNEPDLNYQCQYKDKLVTVELIDELCDRGTASLNSILPSECIQPPPQQRRYDAALLFLIYPLQIVEGEMADRILQDVIENLQGNWGIRRYLGDSFWCRDYKDIPEEIRTTVSGDREQWFRDNGRELKIGEEAQWCIFDPIVSAIFGIKFQKSRQQEDLEKQTYYLNRSLGQLTPEGCKLGELKCPELYYLQDGEYIPGDATPLLWTQANLAIALKMMEKSAKIES